MAETHLKDLIIPEVFDNWVQNDSTKTNNLVNSISMFKICEINAKINNSHYF